MMSNITCIVVDNFQSLGGLLTKGEGLFPRGKGFYLPQGGVLGECCKLT